MLPHDPDFFSLRRNQNYICMQYNIHIYQGQADRLGLFANGATYSHLALLWYINRLRGENRRDGIRENGFNYVRIDHKEVIADMPGLGITTTRGVRKIAEKMEDIGLIVRRPGAEKRGSTMYAILALGEVYLNEPIAPNTVNPGTPVPGPRNSSSGVEVKTPYIVFNNEKGGKGNHIDVFPEQLQKNLKFVSAWDGFVSHRKEVGKKLTPRAAKMMAKSFSKFGVEDIVRAIEKSISSGWTGVFPEKTKQTDSAGEIPASTDFDADPWKADYEA